MPSILHSVVFGKIQHTVLMEYPSLGSLAFCLEYCLNQSIKMIR